MGKGGHDFYVWREIAFPDERQPVKIEGLFPSTNNIRCEMIESANLVECNQHDRVSGTRLTGLLLHPVALLQRKLNVDFFPRQ